MENLKIDEGVIEEEDENPEKDEVGWGILLEYEKNFWTKIIVPNMIYIPIICPLCKNKTFRIYEKVKKDILNPFYLGCNHKTCKKRRSLRYYSFLTFAKTIPASIVHAILCMFIIDKNSAKEIEAKLKSKLKIPTNNKNFKKI